MERYLEQLLTDIKDAAENVRWPYVEEEFCIHDWITDEEENNTAPIRKLEEWTGITKDQLPPPELLSDSQVSMLLSALKNMLDAYNWAFVLQNQVPDRIQYATIRDNFSQEAKVKLWNMGFFQLCNPDTEHGKCSLGEYCQCRFYEQLFEGFNDEDLGPEEDRRLQFECEITHLKRKHGDDWKKYYPYHLDPEYDDENGNPYNYGFNDKEDDDEHDDWWRK